MVARSFVITITNLLGIYIFLSYRLPGTDLGNTVEPA